MEKTLLFTGSNGFLGKNLIPLLKNKYTVMTLDLADADVVSNISTEIPGIAKKIDIVVHAAGKAHSVPKTEEEKKVFFDINYQGTMNLCKGLEKSGTPESFIFISTVAVYGRETGENIMENEPLNGDTPYALSKIKAEEFLTEWSNANNVKLTILRPSLIAGPNPPGNLGAMIQGIKTGRYFNIAGGKSKKSVLMVQDIANLVPFVSDKGGIYNVCDDEQPTFAQLGKLISAQLGKKEPMNIPFWLAKSFALVGDLLGSRAPINSLKLDKITQPLTFSNKKIKAETGWRPLNVLENFKIM